MLLIFVHGWSVTDTSTYAKLPEALAEQSHSAGLDIEIQHIWLGRYISFHDAVSVADVSRAFDAALRDKIPGDNGGIRDFSCITHSTGGPVVREWLDTFYGASDLINSPLRHLVMLAPANHGSSLAALGKERVGRIKAWFAGVEPGQRILDWLSLGSLQQFEAAQAYLQYKPTDSNFFPFVLTGQAIDKKLYDFVNSYLVEKGSDGVVRVAGANLNYSMIKLEETENTEEVDHGSDKLTVNLLKANNSIKRPLTTALGVIPKASHSGKDKGIMGSILSKTNKKPQVGEILECLSVNSTEDYKNRTKALEKLTLETQKGEHRYLMLVFNIKDNQGDPVTDYDLFLLAGNSHNPDKLSKGFFIDRQRNATNPNHLVYYVDYDVIIKNQLTGFRIIARPDEGFAFYHIVEYRSDGVDLNASLKPNETFYIEVELLRRVDKNVFGLDKTTDYDLKGTGGFFNPYTRNSFKDIKPLGVEIDE